jgi:hypothetical protein
MLIKNVAKDIYAGRKLQMLYALQQFNDQDIMKTADDLSIAYRYVLLSDKQMGFIPESRYIKWKKAATDFYVAVSKYCFNGNDFAIGATVNELN